MSREGKTVFNVVMTAPPNQAEEGKRIFKSHRKWMEKTHHRDGNKALLHYDVGIAPEMADPMDPNAKPTGRTHFSLYEVYESPAGLQDHWQQANDNWEDFQALNDWLSKVDMVMVNGGEVKHSLWD